MCVSLCLQHQNTVSYISIIRIFFLSFLITGTILWPKICLKTQDKVLVCMYLFRTDWDQDRITWGNPQKWCSDSLPYLKGHYRCTRSQCYQEQTPVWSKSSVDEHNLYFARPSIIGYLAVETWRVKTVLIIITILHIIIITTSILNLDLKTFAPKILAHTTCINRYWKYTQILAAKIKAKLIAKIELAELTAKIIKYWRLPTIIIYTQNIRLHQNICAHEKFAPMKYSRPWNIRAHEISAPMKCLRPWNVCAH